VAALIPPNPPLSKGGTGLLQLKNWVFNSKTHWILLIRWVFGCVERKRGVKISDRLAV
jgi:hypothetical protein